jgi:hypothetical protein
MRLRFSGSLHYNDSGDICRPVDSVSRASNSCLVGVANVICEEASSGQLQRQCPYD